MTDRPHKVEIEAIPEYDLLVMYVTCSCAYNRSYQVGINPVDLPELLRAVEQIEHRA